MIRGDTFNVVITNTEKIRITKDSIRKSDLPGLIDSKAEEAKNDLANRRLQALASLPKLGIFSDEAHHTYGTKIANTLKRVRQTIDYLHEKTDLVAVISTTGTPYLKRRPLLDVVFWYGLSQGIQDSILKSVSGNIHAYDFDDQSTDDFIAAIIDDFFQNYRETVLPEGHPAKLVIYFPQTDDLAELRPVIETKLTQLGLSPAIVLANTTKSPQAEVDAFHRLNDPASPHRVILLVNKGTEGWDCPSLFATALARKLKTSNNFVLQAACRCLRQVPGNNTKAAIYLSQDNRKTPDKELRETYGETILDLERSTSDSQSAVITLRKIDIPPLVVKQLVTRVVKGDPPTDPLTLALVKPDGFDLSTDSRGNTCYTARISYPKSREHLLRHFQDFVHDNTRDFSFHYSPYNFDSAPEAEYFEHLLKQCDTRPEEVDDFFFTGALTDSRKTDFAVEYQDVDGKWRAYTPDFVIRRKDGRCLIVEIKKDDSAIRAAIDRIDKNGTAYTTEGRKYLALKRWEKLAPERLRYEMKFAEAAGLSLTVQDEMIKYLAKPAIPSNSTSAE